MGRKGTGARKRLAVVLYLLLATLSSAAFVVAATLRGSLDSDRVLGAVWVFALSAIVAASLVPPLLERTRAAKGGTS